MALNLAVIRKALSDQIVNGTGRAVHGYPYPGGKILEPPCVVIRSGEEYINYHADMGPEADINLILDVMAPTRVANKDGLLVLDELLSSAAGEPTSVIDAIEADPTLGGVVESVELGIVGQQQKVAFEDGRAESVIVSIPVQVWVART